MSKKNWFAKVVTDKLDLGDGYWLRVKRFLTKGEERAMQMGGMTHVARTGTEADAQQEIKIDWDKLSFAMCEAYILDWNLDGEDGTPVPYSPETLRRLKTGAEGYDVIDAAIKAHHERWAQEADPAGKKPSLGKPDKTPSS